MSRGCSGGASAATTTTTMSMLAAMARRRCGTCGSARASRLRRGSTAVTRRLSSRLLDEHVVADGQVALLPPGEVGRQRGRDLAVAEQHGAGAGDDAGHDASFAAGRGGRRTARRRPAGRRAQARRSSSRNSSSSGRAGAGLLCPHRRPAQLGRASSESVPLAVVELGEQVSSLLRCFLSISGCALPLGPSRPGAGARRESASRRCAQRRRRAPGASPTAKGERGRPPRGRPGDRDVQTVLDATRGPHEG